MNRGQLTRLLAIADPDPSTGEEQPIYVLDADGFIHTVQYVTWDEDDQCFYISTNFMPEEKKSV